MLIRVIQTLLVGLGAATLAFFAVIAYFSWRIQHTPHQPGIGAVAGGIAVSAPIILLAFAFGAAWNLLITRRR